jgi:hypothetical protein
MVDAISVSMTVSCIAPLTPANDKRLFFWFLDWRTCDDFALSPIIYYFKYKRLFIHSLLISTSNFSTCACICRCYRIFMTSFETKPTSAGSQATSGIHTVREARRWAESKIDAWGIRIDNIVGSHLAIMYTKRHGTRPSVDQATH